MPPIEQFHPMIVHFPIVLVLGLVAFDLVAGLRGVALSGRGCVANVSVTLAVLAGIAAIFAYVFGDIAFDVAVGRGVPEALLETHEDLGTITAITLVVWAILRGIAWLGRMELAGSRRNILLLIEVAIAALIITTAYFGGALVYEHGVNVLG
jgi:uncharacterized membrane protein